MKRFHRWQNSGKPLNEFMRPGDEVDANFAFHFLNRLNATVFDGGIIQIIQPGDDHGGTFATLHRVGEKWFYCGDCAYGKGLLPHDLLMKVEGDHLHVSRCEEDL